MNYIYKISIGPDLDHQPKFGNLSLSNLKLVFKTILIFKGDMTVLNNYCYLPEVSSQLMHFLFSK